jgi:hypothetical protein
MLTNTQIIESTKQVISENYLALRGELTMKQLENILIELAEEIEEEGEGVL